MARVVQRYQEVQRRTWCWSMVPDQHLDDAVAHPVEQQPLRFGMDSHADGEFQILQRRLEVTEQPL